MNNSELESILKKARVPERSKEFLETFPQQIMRRLGHAQIQSRRVERHWFPRLAWGLATAICVLAAFTIGHWHGRLETKTIASNDILQSPKLIQETLAMFPNRVRAIVQDERGLSLVLSEDGNVPASAPLYIRICDGKHCSSLVTFSGQEIQIAGQKLTVLSEAQGGIILMGNQFVWSSTAQTYAQGGLKIEAKRLSSITL
jgi:hypothetical protein